MTTVSIVPMGTYYARYDDVTGTPLKYPEFRTAPAEDIARAKAVHDHLELTALRLGKPVTELSRAELQPYDVSDKRSDQGTHRDPILKAVIGRHNNWHSRKTRRLHFKDGSTTLTVEEIRRLKDAGCGSGIDPRTLLCAQVRAFLNGGSR